MALSVSGMMDGGGTRYSLTETMVSTWIDGRPVYRRVFDLSQLTSNYPTNYPATITFDIPNLDICLSSVTISNEKHPYNTYNGHTWGSLSYQSWMMDEASTNAGTGMGSATMKWYDKDANTKTILLCTTRPIRYWILEYIKTS